MNLSVRRNKTRRGPAGAGISFGLPMRVKKALPVVSEPGDELDGIAELESTVNEPHQSTEPEVAATEPEVAAATSQRNQLGSISARTTSSSSEPERDSEQRPPTREVCKEPFTHRQEKSSEIATVASESVSASKTTDSQVCNQQQSCGMQEGSQSFTTNPPSATINNSRQQVVTDAANLSCQQTLYQMPTPHHQIPTPHHQMPTPHHQMPTPQGPTSSSNGISGSCTIQYSNSITPVVSANGSFSQQNIPQVSHSGPLQAVPGQFHGAGYAPGYPPDIQFARPAVVAPQAPQDVIVVKGKLYQKLGTIGKGGSSKVSSQYHDCFVVLF